MKKYIDICTAATRDEEDWLIDIDTYETVYMTWAEALAYAKHYYTVTRVDRRRSRIFVKEV